MKDLSSLAGFPLGFDPESYEVATAEDMILARAARTAEQMKNVLYAPEAVPPELELYYTFHPERLPQSQADALATRHLTFSFVLLPPLRIGGEYVKTSGHYHGCIPGSSLICPEIYSQLYGRQLLFLQKPDQEDKTKVADCLLIDLSPGMTVEIPPGYLHILINNSQEPALLVGLYRKDVGHDYEPVRAMGGLAYYILSGSDGLIAQANPAYRQTPPLGHLGSVMGTAFEPPEPNVSVVSDFLGRPDKYAFLTDAEAAVVRYGPSGNQRLTPQKDR